jgi:hypothetical protein
MNPMPQVPRKSGPSRLTARQPGWVLIVGMFGGACLFIGLMMIAMLQAPSVRPRVIVTACALIAAGIILLPVAWMKRCRGRLAGPTAADERAHEADHRQIPPT